MYDWQNELILIGTYIIYYYLNELKKCKIVYLSLIIMIIFSNLKSSWYYDNVQTMKNGAL